MISDADLVTIQRELNHIFQEYYIIHVSVNFISIQTGNITQEHLEFIKNRLSSFHINIEPNDKSSLNIVFFKNVKTEV